MARWFVDRSAQRGIPAVSLRTLLPEARFVGCHDLEVSGCSADSRGLDPGQVFVAIRGARYDGHAFVARALERGACGVIVERVCPEAGRLQVVVPDTRSALARLHHALAGDPSHQLKVIALTGDFGTTTTSLFLRAIFEAAVQRFGLVNSLGWSDGVGSHPPGRTPPKVEGWAAMLEAMVERGCVGGVLEVPDATLARRELDGVVLEAAVVTHLGCPTPWDPEAVRQRRRSPTRLFRMVAPGGATVVNADEPEAELLGAVNLESRRVAFGLERPAEVSARIDRVDGSGSRFRLRGFDREATVTLRVAGPRTVSHALAAAAVAWSRGLATDAVVAGLESVRRIPGRFEPIGEGQDFEVRVDRARTGPELTRALLALRTLCSGRLICVLGADAHHDGHARRALALAAEAAADQVVLTSDNPRTEDPDEILRDLLGGFRRPGPVRLEPDRRRAIELALSLARPGDGVLIAGKGHQTYQILDSHVLPFDDRSIAAQWLRRHHPSPRRSIA